MTITVTSKTLNDYDAHLAVNTATAYLRQSDLAYYLIDQLEKQKLKITLEVSSDPAYANKDTSRDGTLVWSLLSDTLISAEASDVSTLLSRPPQTQKPYIASHLNLLHLLALACQQLNDQLNFRDADATWPWLDEKTLSATDIDNVVARELSDKAFPDGQNWDRLLTRN